MPGTTIRNGALVAAEVARAVLYEGPRYRLLEVLGTAGTGAFPNERARPASVELPKHTGHLVSASKLARAIIIMLSSAVMHTLQSVSSPKRQRRHGDIVGHEHGCCGPEPLIFASSIALASAKTQHCSNACKMTKVSAPCTVAACLEHDDDSSVTIHIHGSCITSAHRGPWHAVPSALHSRPAGKSCMICRLANHVYPYASYPLLSMTASRHAQHVNFSGQVRGLCNYRGMLLHASR